MMMPRPERSRLLAAALVALVALGTGACAATTGVRDVRFANAAPVWSVNDRVDTSELPGEGFAILKYFFDRFFFRRVESALAVRERAHAANVNALDEVPDSTWFTNRAGVRELSVDEVRRGPNVDDGPDRSEPWTIKGTKTGGLSVGFRIEDARGVDYILKFDQKGIPEMETAADVIVQRLLWACGFNVPEDTIVEFTLDQLYLSPDATVADTFGNERPMTRRDLDEALSLVNSNDDGTYRGLASKFLQGRPVGGASPEGTREGDPNDLVPHEDRRDLRGQYVVFSWLGHTDVKLDNTLDMYVEDPTDAERHYVLHYLLDFGKAMGAMGWIHQRATDNFTYNLDVESMLLALLSAGFYDVPGTNAHGPGLPGVGRFEAAEFEPDTWRAEYPWEPFLRMDRFDGFWGAKIVARFTEPMIRAAVEQGRYSDPRATDYMVATLVERQRKIADYWFRQVAPLDQFEIKVDGTLRFRDLAVDAGVIAPASETRYTAVLHDRNGRAIGAAVESSPGERHLALSIPNGEDYAIVSVRTRRGDRTDRPIDVHLGRDDRGQLRVIGLARH